MKEKVLVVDDEWEIRDVLSNFLTEKGYEVILASNGEEAIELAEKENPHVILLDVKMPGIDGIETCRRFKEGEKTRYIPVIMITAFLDREIEAYLEGADDFVVKPFQGASRDAVREVRKQSAAMPLQGVGQFGKMFHTEATGLVNPSIQEDGAKLCVGQIPKCAQVLFEQISGVEGFIDLHEHHEPFKGAGFEVFQGSE